MEPNSRLYGSSKIGLQSTLMCRPLPECSKHRYNPSLDPTPNLLLGQRNKHTQGLTLAKVKAKMKEMTETRGLEVRG